MSTNDQNPSNTVILAIIALIGTLGAALFANWDKVFQKSTFTPPVIPTISPSPISSPMRSPQKLVKPSPLKIATKFESLKKSLSDRNWVEADLATDLLRPKSLSCPELLFVNKLWLNYSNNNFGYSVQRGIWKHKNLNGKYNDFAEFVGWKRDGRYAVNIHDPILNTNLDSPDQAPLGHLPFNGWQVKGNIRKDFDVFMRKLAKCKI